MQCRNGCGATLTFSDKVKSASGKMIPIDSVSGQPHQCPNSDFAMKKKDPELGKSVIEVVQDLQQRMMALEKMFEERMTKLEMSRWS